MTIQSFIFYFAFFAFFLVYQISSVRRRQSSWKWILGATVLWLISLQPSSLFPLIIACVCTWLIGQRIKNEDRSKNYIWLTLGISVCLLNWVLCKKLNIYSKLGVSFYSLQLISFLIDKYRRLEFPEMNLLQFITSTSAFYALSSGPVLKTRDHILELKNPRFLTNKVVQLALFRIVWGLLKKTIGDQLGETIQLYYRFDGAHDLLTAWTIVLGITAQYYADLSGYSDIAIGLASLLGIKIPENFNLPFLATNMADHWRRWHISLSVWFQEYVFYPLCLFRPLKWMKAQYKIPLAVLMTMLLVGIWHEFNLNSLIWGIYNGLLIVIGAWSAKKMLNIHFRGKKVFAILLTFFLAMMGRVLNRTAEWSQAVRTWRELFQSIDTSTVSSYQWFTLSLTVLAIVGPHFVDWYYVTKMKAGARTWPIMTASFFILCVVIIFGFAGKPFLYEQF